LHRLGQGAKSISGVYYVFFACFLNRFGPEPPVTLSRRHLLATLGLALPAAALLASQAHAQTAAPSAAAPAPATTAPTDAPPAKTKKKHSSKTSHKSHKTKAPADKPTES
jgi:hypothetical protein